MVITILFPSHSCFFLFDVVYYLYLCLFGALYIQPLLHCLDLFCLFTRHINTLQKVFYCETSNSIGKTSSNASNMCSPREGNYIHHH